MVPFIVLICMFVVGWCFTALQHFSGHFGRSQLTYPHCSWVSLLGSLQYLVHILLPVTDNCPSLISGRERMAIEIISWPNSTKECCWTWGSNPWPSAYQADGHSIELLRPVIRVLDHQVLCSYKGNLRLSCKQTENLCQVCGWLLSPTTIHQWCQWLLNMLSVLTYWPLIGYLQTATFLFTSQHSKTYTIIFSPIAQIDQSLMGSCHSAGSAVPWLICL